MKKDFTFEWLKHYTETMHNQILKERKRIENEKAKILEGLTIGVENGYDKE